MYGSDELRTEKWEVESGKWDVGCEDQMNRKLNREY